MFLNNFTFFLLSVGVFLLLVPSSVRGGCGGCFLRKRPKAVDDFKSVKNKIPSSPNSDIIDSAVDSDVKSGEDFGKISKVIHIDGVGFNPKNLTRIL